MHTERLAKTSRPGLRLLACAAEEMHAHIKGSELVVLPDATHRVQVTNAADVVAGIRAFIGRRGAP